MEDIEEKIKKLTQLFEEVAECPVCFGTMESTLKQCINGHGVCSSCASKITKCPSCQQELVIRKNILLERLFECIPKQCPNSVRGCSITVFNKEHEAFCEFRISKCMRYGCEWEGSVNHLVNHIKTCTKGGVVFKCTSLNTYTECFYTFEKAQTGSFYTPIIFEDQLFWKYFYRNGITKRISHGFYHVAKSKPTTNYYLIISFKKDDISYFTYSCRASTDLNDRNNVDESGFIIPDSELERFSTPQSEYSYHMKIIAQDIVK